MEWSKYSAPQGKPYVCMIVCLHVQFSISSNLFSRSGSCILGPSLHSAGAFVEVIKVMPGQYLHRQYI